MPVILKPPESYSAYCRCRTRVRKLARFPNNFVLRTYILLNPCMDQISDLPQVVSHQTPSYTDALIGGWEAYVEQSKSFTRYVSYAIQTLHEYDLAAPDVDCITLIVQSALAAQSLFFAASLHHPGQDELYQVFETFVLNCVIPPKRRSCP